jgi:hypothetical protein
MSNPRTARRVRRAPLSIRLSDAEKTALQTRAAGAPLGTFIKRVLFSDPSGGGIRITKRRYPVKDTEALGQVLGLLGKSRLANNLNQLAKAANLGALPVTEETEADLRAACADVAAMRRLLLRALGVVADEAKPSAAGLVNRFGQAAGRPPQ